MRPPKVFRNKEEEDSDSDESFQCLGHPDDLLEDNLSLEESPRMNQKELHLPDEEDYYLYRSGLRRQSTLVDSDRTAVVRDLVIKTTQSPGGSIASPSSETMSLQASTISTKSPKWKIKGKFCETLKAVKDLDLVIDSPTSQHQPNFKANAHEVCLPDDERYYSYDAGLQRKNSLMDSDSTQEGRRILIIKTDLESVQSSSRGKIHRPVKLTNSPKTKHIYHRVRKLSSQPLHLRNPSPEAAQPQASSIPPTPSSSRRRNALLFSPETLPQDLRELKDVEVETIDISKNQERSLILHQNLTENLPNVAKLKISSRTQLKS